VTPPTDARETGDLSLVDALAQLSFLIQGALSEAIADHDLSIIQTRLLGILRDRDPTMNELGGYLHLDKSSITGLVQRAEQRGLVRRTVSTRDRRAVHVSITDAGRHIGEQVALKFDQRIAAITSGLTRTERARLAALACRLLRS
jgi:MarR family transcriptional regulator, lower aerobic nicotinate degradation pathway regulator